jgi:GNAT superfamily N-acetyltransferase
MVEVELSDRYRYQEKGITVPVRESLGILFQGQNEAVLTPLKSKEGLPVEFACTVKGNTEGRRWFLLTAIAGDSPLGFIDVWFLPDAVGGPAGKVQYPYVLRTIDFDFPHSEIRGESGDDGFFVREQERGRGLGRALFFTSMEMLRLAGAKALHVCQPSESSKALYKRWGGKEILGGYLFDLT